MLFSCRRLARLSRCWRDSFGIRRGRQGALAGSCHRARFRGFHTGAKADAAKGGQLLLGELNCTSCHATKSPVEGSLSRKQAPILDGVASRARRSLFASSSPIRKP